MLNEKIKEQIQEEVSKRFLENVPVIPAIIEVNQLICRGLIEKLPLSDKSKSITWLADAFSDINIVKLLMLQNTGEQKRILGLYDYWLKAESFIAAGSLSSRDFLEILENYVNERRKEIRASEDFIRFSGTDFLTIQACFSRALILATGDDAELHYQNDVNTSFVEILDQVRRFYTALEPANSSERPF